MDATTGICIVLKSPPVSCYEEAFQRFMHAECLSPGFRKKNRLMIVECYVGMNMKLQAQEWLQKTLDVPSLSSEDKECHQQEPNNSLINDSFLTNSLLIFFSLSHIV